MKKKDRYLKIVEWSDEDQCYVGSIPGWIGKCCHGVNEVEVYHQLGQILEEWIEVYEEDKIPSPSADNCNSIRSSGTKSCCLRSD